MDKPSSRSRTTSERSKIHVRHCPFMVVCGAIRRRIPGAVTRGIYTSGNNGHGAAAHRCKIICRSCTAGDRAANHVTSLVTPPNVH